MDIHTLTRRPRDGRARAVLRPRSPQEVVGALRYAADDCVPLTVRGSGRRGRGQRVAGGLVVDLSSLDAVVDVAADRVVVEAGATWRQVLDATLPFGLAPGVLPDDLDLSVGGSVVVGELGATRTSYGFVTDAVLELDLVTGAGGGLSCSPTHRPQLFDVVRAGLGQVGLVTRVTLALAPVSRPMRVARLEHADPGSPGRITAFVGAHAIESVLKKELADGARVVLTPVRPATVRTPLVRLPEAELVVGVTVEGMPAMENRRLYERVRAAGGTLHPASAVPMSPADWRAHFGRQHERIQAARRIFDPACRLAPGYRLFDEDN